MPVDPPTAPAAVPSRKYAGPLTLILSFLVVLGALLAFAPTSWPH